MTSKHKTRWLLCDRFLHENRIMPTSSQAMILKCSDGGRNGRISYRCVSPTRCAPFLKEISPRRPKSVRKQACELVKFDFTLNTEAPSSSEFEGVFVYDNKTKSYHWQISSISPRSQHDRSLMSRNPSGDNIENIEKSPSKESSFIPPEPSEYTKHFTTPSVSLLDNTKHVINPRTEFCGINPRTELYGCSQPLTTLNIPPDSEALDESSYKRLECLGFRRRTQYTPGGSLIRTLKGKSSLRYPIKCIPDVSPLLIDSTAKLTINNLDPLQVPPPSVIPFKRQGFTQNTYMKSDPVKKRVRSVKQPKSLLDDAKDSVNWDKRVTPTTNLRRGPIKSAPNAICFSLRNMYKFSHLDVKDLIELRFGIKVKTLQYDPVSVRMADPGSCDRWVVTLTSPMDCVRVIQQGITMDGDKVIIRLWDDVQREETIDSSGAFDLPCRYRLQQEKHNQVLKNFLAVH